MRPSLNDPAGSEFSHFLPLIDHLVYATPDLEATVSQLRTQLGVQPTPGGQHPARGTRNALVALGRESYLEVIGPDPGQPPPPRARPFGIDDLHEPRLAAWAVKGTDLERVVIKARRHGVDLGQVLSGSRTRPDGLLLSWKLTDFYQPQANGVLPFFIDWEKTSHPAWALAQACSLLGLHAEHPDAERVQKMLDNLGVILQVAEGPLPSLLATIKTPRGTVILR
jgi:hypothetical protein